MNKSMKGLIATYLWSVAPGWLDAPDPLKGVDIEKEYKLIKEKKSNLSASKRRMVVYRYEEGDK